MTSVQSIPIETIDKLQAIWQSVSALGAELDERQWKLPTDLDGWTVQDNLAHLIGTERKLQGLPPAAIAGRLRRVRQEPHRAVQRGRDRGPPRSTGAEVLAEWNTLIALRVATLRSADEAYFAQEMSTPTGPGTMADFLHIRVLDCWIHEQDMRRAVGKPGHLGGPAAEHTVDRLLRTIPIVVGKRAATPEGGAVVIDITGDVSRHVVCEVIGRAGGDRRHRRAPNRWRPSPSTPRRSSCWPPGDDRRRRSPIASIWPAIDTRSACGRQPQHDDLTGVRQRSPRSDLSRAAVPSSRSISVSSLSNSRSES